MSEDIQKKKDITLTKGQAIGSAGVLGLGGIVALFMKLDGYFYSRREGIELKSRVERVEESYNTLRDELKEEISSVKNDVKDQLKEVVATIRRTEDTIVTRQTQTIDRLVNSTQTTNNSLENRIRALENEVSSIKSKK